MPLGTNDRAAATGSCIPFTGIEITDKGVAWLSDWIGQIREIIGMDIPLSTDHFGHIGVNSCIKLARAMEKWNLAWMEDMVPWQFPELLKQIKDSTTVPLITGEDIYLKESFMKLIDAGAVDMIHPDLASAGGLMETKKIGDYAMEHGVAMAMHFAGTPGVVHGQRPLRGGERELHGARAPLARRALVGDAGTDGRRQAAGRQGFRCRARTLRASASSSTRTRSGSTSGQSRLLRHPRPSGTRSEATTAPGAERRSGKPPRCYCGFFLRISSSRFLR